MVQVSGYRNAFNLCQVDLCLLIRRLFSANLSVFQIHSDIVAAACNMVVTAVIAKIALFNAPGVFRVYSRPSLLSFISVLIPVCDRKRCVFVIQSGFLFGVNITEKVFIRQICIIKSCSKRFDPEILVLNSIHRFPDVTPEKRIIHFHGGRIIFLRILHLVQGTVIQYCIIFTIVFCDNGIFLTLCA